MRNKFHAINALICTWEIALLLHRAHIRETYEQLKAKWGRRLPPNFVLLDDAGLADALTLSSLRQSASEVALKSFEEAVAAEDGAALTALSAEKLGELLEADTLIVRCLASLRPCTQPLTHLMSDLLATQ